ncbi:LAFA_0F21440g1_1 [Lachancea sp. 'fantastica']|nr:LAFA_0F21440g1_1 [Lachancea sp. 'fantastica']
MSNSLEERLRINSSAFDGLLSLIPAKYYYDDKTQDQWKQKKKSKEQSKLDKRSKLDPELQNEDSASALDIKAQREMNGKPVVLPGTKAIPQTSDSEEEVEEEEDQAESKSEEEEEEEEEVVKPQVSNVKKSNVTTSQDDTSPKVSEGSKVASEDEDAIDVVFDDQGNEVGVQKDVSVKHDGDAPKDASKPDRKQNLAKLRAKLQEKIQSLKEKRKAPGSLVTGAPSSREAILEQRKCKQEQKRKRAELDKAKQDESSENESSDSEDDEEDQINLQSKKRKTSNGEDLTADLMFQNIEFDDGDRATSDLQRLRKAGNKKGPAKNDIKAHLHASEQRRAKLEAKDELDQIKQKEKEKWQRAMLQAEGEKMKNDEKLLRKALKRKEAKKRKSAVEWRERKETVATAISDKQKRREENLQIRKDNKGKKRSHQEKMKRGIKGIRPKRAGFEGRLKSQKKR